MNEKMTLLFLKQTGHVLASLTRVAVPAIALQTGKETEQQKKDNEAFELRALAGEQLIVRSYLADSATPLKVVVETAFPISSPDLRVFTFDLNPEVLLDPRAHIVNTAQEIEPARSDVTSLIFTPTSSTINVKLPPDVSTPTQVRVQTHLKGGSDPDPQPLKGITTNVGSTTIQEITFPSSLVSGDTYQALILVAGFSPLIKEETAT
jgi:hypothetical protein